jgi:hypothetical protein
MRCLQNEKLRRRGNHRSERFMFHEGMNHGIYGCHVGRFLGALELVFLEGEAGMGIVTVRHKYHKCGEEVEKCEM